MALGYQWKKNCRGLYDLWQTRLFSSEFGGVSIRKIVIRSVSRDDPKYNFDDPWLPIYREEIV